MNRQFVSVILGGFGGSAGPQMEVEGEQVATDQASVAAMLNDADSIVIIPATAWRSPKPNRRSRN